MRIHTKIVIDFDGKVIEDEHFDYQGPVSQTKTKTQQKTDIPPPTAAELRLQQINAQIGQLQLDAIRQQGGFQQNLSVSGAEASQEQLRLDRLRRLIQSGGQIPLQGQQQAPTPLKSTLPEGGRQNIKNILDTLKSGGNFGFGPTPTQTERDAEIKRLEGLLGPTQTDAISQAGIGFTQAEIDRVRGQLDQEQQFTALNQELVGLQLQATRQGSAATDKQIGLINEASEAAIALGSSDIDRFTKEGLNLVAGELAPSLGLRPTDTPIQDRGFRLAEEGVRQKSQLQRQIRGQAASAQLNFPLAAGAFDTAQRGATQQFSQAAQQFQNQLQQQAFINRLNLTNQASSSGLSLAGLGNPLGAQQILAGQRVAGATTSSSSFNPFQTLGAIGGGILGFGIGGPAGAAVGASGFALR
jgi:hypothetical protein